jgi:hypothetical protein
MQLRFRGLKITQADLIQSEIIIKKLLQARNNCGTAEYLSDCPPEKHNAIDSNCRDNSRRIGNHSGGDIGI